MVHAATDGIAALRGTPSDPSRPRLAVLAALPGRRGAPAPEDSTSERRPESSAIARTGPQPEGWRAHRGP